MVAFDRAGADIHSFILNGADKWIRAGVGLVGGVDFDPSINGKISRPNIERSAVGRGYIISGAARELKGSTPYSSCNRSINRCGTVERAHIPALNIIRIR